MPEIPSLSGARRVPMLAAVEFRLGSFNPTALLEDNPPRNAVTAFRESAGLRVQDLAAVTGIPAGVFLMIESATPLMSSRELLALCRAYGMIAEAHARGRRTPPTLTHSIKKNKRGSQQTVLGRALRATIMNRRRHLPLSGPLRTYFPVKERKRFFPTLRTPHGVAE